MNCGLLGAKLGHSYSPQIHRHFGCYTYELFEKTPEELEDFLKSGDFVGLNVTIPYKKDVIAYCDELSPIAKKLGAVNTIVRTAQGKLIGHNTDYFGFLSMVRRTGLQLNGKRVLVLGTGGASATVQEVLREIGATVTVISRSGADNYETMYQYDDTAAIVNATPVGMYPHNGEVLVDLSKFPKLEGVLDLIYNPARTQLLMDAQSLGLAAENGLWMLVAQAKESAEWFTGNPISDRIIEQIYHTLCKQMQNIVLIGMPGCGKSEVGKLLASLLGRPFVDADAAIVQKAGMSIPEIFKKYGECKFREIETDVLSELGKASGTVIATGGGCVTQIRNYPLMHQNGRMIWLKRDISLLPTDGRPISQQNSIETIYEQRKALYANFADLTVYNNADPGKAVETIIATEELQ